MAGCWILVEHHIPFESREQSWNVFLYEWLQHFVNVVVSIDFNTFVNELFWQLTKEANSRPYHKAPGKILMHHFWQTWVYACPVHYYEYIFVVMNRTCINSSLSIAYAPSTVAYAHVKHSLIGSDDVSPLIVVQMQIQTPSSGTTFLNLLITWFVNGALFSQLCLRREMIILLIVPTDTLHFLAISHWVGRFICLIIFAVFCMTSEVAAVQPFFIFNFSPGVCDGFRESPFEWRTR